MREGQYCEWPAGFAPELSGMAGEPLWECWWGLFVEWMMGTLGVLRV